MALLSSFHSICTLVCLTSVCVRRQYNYVILMCGTYLYFVSCFFFQVLLTRVVIYNYILTIVAAALSCKSTIKYIYDEDFTLL